MKYNHLKKFIVVFFATVLIGSACVLPTMAEDETNIISGCSTPNLINVAKYYGYLPENVQSNQYELKDQTLYVKDRNVNFSCDVSKENAIGYKTVLLQYRDPEAQTLAAMQDSGFDNKDFKIVNQMIVATNADLDANDIAMDIRNGQFIVSGILHSDTDAWNMIYDSFQKIIVGITGVGILICLLAFTLQFIKLGSVADNPSERAKVLKGIIWSGVGTAGCGAATLIFGIAFGLI